MVNLSTLTHDLKQAATLAVSAAAQVEDTGTCNMDGIFLKLPRTNAAKVIEAVRAAGLRACKIEKHSWFGTGYLVTTPSVGQAYKNERAAETMWDYMKAQGWNVYNWCQAD